MKQIKFFITMVLLCLCHPISAQENLSLDQSALSEIRSSSNAIVAFQTGEGLSGGRFKFKQDDSPDADMDLIKVTVEIPLGEEDDQFIPFFSITPAYMDIDQKSDASPIGISLNSWSLAAGGGLRMKFFDNLVELTPRMKFDYSELDYNVDGLDMGGGDILPGVNAVAYIPSIEGKIMPEINQQGTRLILGTLGSYVYLDGDADRNLGDFNDSSWIWKNSVAIEDYFLDPCESGKIFYRPKITRVDMHGSARDGFGFNNFYEYGIELFSQEIVQEYFKEIGMGLAYIHEDEIQGWRFGIFGDLN